MSPDRRLREVLSLGLTFDVMGLKESGDRAARCAEVGTDSPTSLWDAIDIGPSEHIAGGRTLPVVVRVLAGLAADLAALNGLQAIRWNGSGAVMSPATFALHIGRWLQGGAFPAPDLTAIVRVAPHVWRSRGLALFSGYELEIASTCQRARQEVQRRMLHMMHAIVEGRGEPANDVSSSLGLGLVSLPGAQSGPGGRVLRLRWSG